MEAVTSSISFALVAHDRLHGRRPVGSARLRRSSASGRLSWSLRNRFISESLLYAAVLTLVVSRSLHRLVRRRDKLTQDALPFDRWARLVASISQQLLDTVLSPRPDKSTERRLLTYLRNEGPDPNRARLPLATRGQQRLYLPARAITNERVICKFPGPNWFHAS